MIVSGGIPTDFSDYEMPKAIIMNCFFYIARHFFLPLCPIAGSRVEAATSSGCSSCADREKGDREKGRLTAADDQE